MTAPLGNYALKALTPESAVIIDRSRCVRHRCAANACTRCIDACPAGAISWNESGLGIDAGACTQCLSCLAVCPTAALASPGLSLLRLLSDLAEHPRPVLGCTVQPDMDAHASMSCLGYLAHPEVMTLLALVFADGLQINLTSCGTCPNNHMVQEVEMAHRQVGDLVPGHAIKLITTCDELDFQAPSMSRRQLFSLFKERATRVAATMVGRLQSVGTSQSYGSKQVPVIRLLLLKALQESSKTLRLHIADRLFGKISFTGQCTGSERCVGVCPTGAIQSSDEDSGPPEFNQNLCVSCNSCQAFCGNQAVFML